jgi:hypothetical protein
LSDHCQRCPVGVSDVVAEDHLTPAQPNAAATSAASPNLAVRIAAGKRDLMRYGRVRRIVIINNEQPIFYKNPEGSTEIAAEAVKRLRELNEGNSS